MSMQALNQLVARSIIDPTVVQAFRAGQIGEVLHELDFAADMRSKLEQIEADSWAEFAVLSYRTVKAAEVKAPRIVMPSTAEGLYDDTARTDQEQVA